MSEFSEERRDEQLNEEELEEGSTIFSAPEEKNDKTEKPKLLKKILIGVVALVLLAGIITGLALLVDKIVPDEGDGDVDEYFVLNKYVTLNESTGSEALNYDAVSKIDLQGNDEIISIYSKLGEEEDASTLWLESSIPEEYTSETAVSAIAKTALGMKYTRIISEDIKEGVDYGFDKPLYTAEVTPYEGDGFTITVGKLSPDQSGYYVTVSGEDKVYLVKGSYIDGLSVEDKMELTKALTVSAFSESEGSAEYYNSGVLAKFDNLYFANKKLGNTYKFETVDQTEGQSYNTYTVTEPIKRGANDVGIVPIIELFSNGISSKGLYRITKTDADLRAYGLDNPDLSVSIKAGKQERSIKAKLQDDGDYALIASDYDVVLRVDASALTPVDLEEKDIFSTFLFIETLADLDKITVSGGTVNNVFTVATEDNEDGSKKISGIGINGAEPTAPEEFQSYYQFLLGIKTLDYSASDLSGKTPEATITMTKKDNSKATVIEYYEVKNGRYQVVVNGEQMGIIGSSSFKNILKYSENVAAGKVYNS